MTGRILIATGLFLAALASGTDTAGAAVLEVPGNHQTIAAAFEVARPGDRVVVGPGVHYESGLVMPVGVALVGATGDPGDVIIDGGGSNRILLLEGLDGSSIIADLTFRNGRATGGANYDKSGGAIFCSNSSPRISNCVFTANSGDGHGGAIRCNSAQPLITGCVFVGNQADSGGGGAIDCSFDSAPLIRGCTFRGNTAAWGGALSSRGYSSPSIYASEFEGNSAVGGKGYGGAVFADLGSLPTFERVTLHGNVARYGGAIACFGDAEATLTQCTVVGNTALVMGGGVLAYGSRLRVESSIIAFHDGTGISAEAGASPQVSCSNIYGNTGGDWTGPLAALLTADDNLSADPKFCDYGLGGTGYVLESGSPSGGDGASCGVMGAWPVGCDALQPAVAGLIGGWQASGARIEWQALHLEQSAVFRVTASWSQDPDMTWEVPVRSLGGGFYEAMDSRSDTDDGGTYTYTVQLGDGAGAWSQLGEISLDAVPRFQGIRDLLAAPNPFNPQTTISFRLSAAQRARVSIYTPDGRRISVLADQEFPAGLQSLTWDGRDKRGAQVGSGLYIVLVEGQTQRLTRKITLLK